VENKKRRWDGRSPIPAPIRNDDLKLETVEKRLGQGLPGGHQGVNQAMRKRNQEKRSTSTSNGKSTLRRKKES